MCAVCWIVCSFVPLSVCLLFGKRIIYDSFREQGEKEKKGEGKEYGIERSHNNNKNIMK